MLLAAHSTKGHLRVDGNATRLNDVDGLWCADILESVRHKESILCIYPIPNFLIPSLLIAAIIIERFAATPVVNLVPRILFYGSSEERDLYLTLTVGPESQLISEVFGVVRLDSDGIVRETAGKASTSRITVSRHCILPKDSDYKPNIVIADETHFGSEKFAELMRGAIKRWSEATFVVFSANPLTAMLSVSASHKWRLLQLPLRDVAKLPMGPPGELDPLRDISTSLGRVKKGISRQLVALNSNSAAWQQAKEFNRMAEGRLARSPTSRTVVGLWRRIAAMCVKPSEYEKYKSLSMFDFKFFLNEVRELAQREGPSATLLAGAAVAFRELLDELEIENPKGSALRDAVTATFVNDKKVTVVLGRRGQRYLTERAAYADPDLREIIDAGKVTFISADSVATTLETDQLVFPAILPRSLMWAYRTAKAATMTYIAYDFEVPLLRWCLRESLLEDVSLSIVTDFDEKPVSKIEQGAPFEINIDAIDWLPDFEDAENIEPNQRPTSGRFMEVEFTDGTILYFPIESSVQVVIERKDDVQQREVSDLKEGDQVLVIDEGRKRTLFDLLRERIDSRTSLSKDFDLVRAFGLLLRGRYESSTLDCPRLLQKIIEMGSLITTPETVWSWVNGTTFGPSDPKDIVRLGNALEIAPFSTDSAAFYRAMQRVRLVHRMVGFELVKLLKTAVLERRATNLKLRIGDDIILLDDFVDAVDVKKVKAARKVSYG